MGHQAGQRVPASFRQPAEPVTAPNTFGLLPDRRAPFWTFDGAVGREAGRDCDDRIPGTYIRRAPNLRPLHRSPEASPVRNAVFADAKAGEARQMSASELERELHRRGQELVRKLLQGLATNAGKRLLVRPRARAPAVSSARSRRRARKPRRNGLRHDAGCGSGLRAARSRRLASARCRAEPAAGLLGRDAPPRERTTAYALEATVVLTSSTGSGERRAVLRRRLHRPACRRSASRPAHGDTWLQLRRSAAAGSTEPDERGAARGLGG